ncbi:MAG: enoyl-CoA hydratase/isomerase family protein [Nocardioidaceae bacterium]|nr:enoyl-CoA hydratase/isomerase family protein [Nocardioidaceae bacterium]
MSEPVTYDVRDQVATLRLDRADAMNSLDIATKESLLASVRRAANDPDVRCVVLTGSGRAFSVGQDLREHIERLGTESLEEVWSTVEKHYAPIALALATMEKPVIAAINGVAAGAGLSIALACDLRIAADTAGFNTAFTGVGLSCDTGASWTLPRLIGAGRALELLLLPRTVDAVEALELGLVNQLVPAADLMATAHGLATRLAAGPTLAYAAVKRSVAYAASRPLDEALAYEGQMMARTGGSSDHQHAVASFVVKEKPTFEGR